MKKLKDIVKNILDLNSDHVICAKKPWDAKSECIVAKLEEDDSIPLEVKNAHFEYFLEVFLAIEILEDFKDKIHDDQHTIDLLIYYAKNDAYLDWIY